MPAEHAHAPPAVSFAPVLAIGVLFFIFGFVTWLNGPLIAFVKLAFTLDDVNAFLVLMVFYLSYLVFALPASAILRRTGMKRGMAVGFVIMAIGAALFGQFATLRLYPGALTGLFVIGAGLAILQTAANPYVSIVGPIESAAQRIAFMGICNKFAGFLAPFVFGALVLRGFENFADQVKAAATPQARDALLDAFAARVHWPYLSMAALLLLLAIWIARSSLPDIRPGDVNPGKTRRDDAGLFAFPHLWLGVLCLFLYVGVEVMAGDAIVVYGAGFGLPVAATSLFTSYTLFAMMVGYIVGLMLTPRYIAQELYLALSAALGALFSLAAMLSKGHTSIAFIAALGFANAMMWPAIFPLAIRGLGRHTEAGSALLIMGIAGGALLPYAFALLKLHVDFQIAFALICVPAYLYILYYGLRGCRAGR